MLLFGKELVPWLLFLAKIINFAASFSITYKLNEPESTSSQC